LLTALPRKNPEVSNPAEYSSKPLAKRYLDCMARIETSLEIPAPPERVWAVLTDIASYRDWNPLVRGWHGDLSLGGLVEIEVAKTGQDGQTLKFKARIVELKTHRRFAWRGEVKFIFSGLHFFELRSSATGTMLIHGEEISGLYAWIAGRKWMRTYRPLYEELNVALASEVQRRERLSISLSA
jgi:hypothetical protein